MRTAALCLLLALPVLPVQADALAQLDYFVQGAKSLKAQFSQVVHDRNGKKIQEATGTLFLSRPGKFRWIYKRPYAQLLVGDGKKLWIYDEDLDQVTTRKLDQAIGESPAALLAGDADLDKLFNLKNIADRDGLEWLEARPKSKEGSFEKVRMGFRGNDLSAMELHDNFGQTTFLRFTSLEKNPALAASLFRFSPPKGADVIGE